MIFGTDRPPEKFSLLFSQQLESLRGISAIVVLFSHCFQAFIAPFDDTFYSVARLLGQAAVMMFFALSGYLIGHSIQKNLAQNPQFSLKQYSQHRCKRILPPFIFALILTAFLYAIAPYFFASGSRDFVYTFGIMIRSEYAIELQNFIASAFFLNGFLSETISANAALWSLSYEVWFYVLAGFLPFIFIRANATASIGAISLLAVLAWFNLQFLIYFLIWLFAFALSFATWRISLQAHFSALKYFFAVSAILIAALDFYQFHYVYMSNEYTTENFTIFNLCMGISFACFIAQLHLKQVQFKAIFTQSADFSYTLYVSHFPILLFMMGCFPQSLSSFRHAVFAVFISMIVIIFMAYVLAKMIEPKRKIA